MDNVPSTPQQSGEPTVVNTSTLPPKSSSKKRRIALILIVVVVLVGIGFAFKAFLPESRSLLDTIKLSNGKEVSLGQSTKYLEAELGLKKEAHADVYLYPPNTRIDNPLQATFFVNEDKVVAIRLRLNEANTHKETNLHINSYITDVPLKTNNQAREINEKVEGGTSKGYVLDGDKSKAYFLINPCTPPPDRIVLIAVVLDGYEKLALGSGAGCGLRS